MKTSFRMMKVLSDPIRIWIVKRLQHQDLCACHLSIPAVLEDGGVKYVSKILGRAESGSWLGGGR